MRRGFTLAEVLITLGIIGVVAALVMPSLIANYRKKAWVTQLQKSVSVWDNAMNLARSQSGVDSLEDTALFKSIEDIYYGTVTGEQTAFQAEFRKYFNVVKFVPSVDTNDYSPLSGIYTGGAAFAEPPPTLAVHGLAAYLADGTKFIMALTPGERSATIPCEGNDGYSVSGMGGSYCYALGNIAIDVNGDKGPNKNGRDVFYFQVTSTGRLVPAFSHDWAVFFREGEHAGFMATWQSAETCDTSAPSYGSWGISGQGCAARIMENGWVMDY